MSQHSSDHLTRSPRFRVVEQLKVTQLEEDLKREKTEARPRLEVRSTGSREITL